MRDEHTNSESYNFASAPNTNSQDTRGRGGTVVHEAERQQVAEKVYLHYFNDELYRRGLISEAERNRMALKIESRKPSLAFLDKM